MLFLFIAESIPCVLITQKGHGQIAFQGDLSKSMAFVKLGEYVHITKGTSFGPGKYEIHKWFA
jgi:hypothetical protein